MKPDIPQEQLDRIQPIVEQLLADLRRRTQELPPVSEPALIYEARPEGER